MKLLPMRAASLTSGRRRRRANQETRRRALQAWELQRGIVGAVEDLAWRALAAGRETLGAMLFGVVDAIRDAQAHEMSDAMSRERRRRQTQGSNVSPVWSHGELQAENLRGLREVFALRGRVEELERQVEDLAADRAAADVDAAQLRADAENWRKRQELTLGSNFPPATICTEVHDPPILPSSERTG